MSTPSLTVSELLPDDDEWLTQSQIKHMSEEITTRIKGELIPIIETLKEENKVLQQSLESRRQSCTMLRSRTDVLEAVTRNQAGIILREREKIGTLEREKEALEEEIRILKSRQQVILPQIPLSPMLISRPQTPSPKAPKPKALSPKAIVAAPHLLQAYERAEHARRHSRQRD
jgi:hypothetical protein